MGGDRSSIRRKHLVDLLRVATDRVRLGNRVAGARDVSHSSWILATPAGLETCDRSLPSPGRAFSDCRLVKGYSNAENLEANNGPQQKAGADEKQ
jgi:hypothetical protein